MAWYGWHGNETSTVEMSMRGQGDDGNMEQRQKSFFDAKQKWDPVRATAGAS